MGREKQRKRNKEEKKRRKKRKSLTRGFCVLDLATSVVNSAVLPTKTPTSNLEQHYRKTKTSNRVKEKERETSNGEREFLFPELQT